MPSSRQLVIQGFINDYEFRERKERRKRLLDIDNYLYAIVNCIKGALMPRPGVDKQVSAIRAFNRFYTRKIGVINGTASSPFSLAEARILFELAHHEKPTATDIRKELGVDAGYLSRILRDFERRKLVKREQSKADERQWFLSLTRKGLRAFVPLDERSNRDAAAMIEAVPATERGQLVDAIETVRRLLDDKREVPRTPYLLRIHQPGDMGWMVYRQAILYAEEYGWDGTYEALAAEIVAGFIRNYDPKMERAWIAEKDGKRVGAVFIAKESDEIAKLRLLHVDPEAASRGMHAIFEAGRVPEDNAVDTEHSSCRPAHLQTGRIQDCARREAS